MNISGNIFIKHLLIMVGIIAMMMMLIVYPFFPGDHDFMAVPTSIGIQVLATSGLLLVPIGVCWLVYDMWIYKPTCARMSYLFAVVSMIVGSVPVLLFAIVTYASTSPWISMVMTIAWLYVIVKLVPTLKILKEDQGMTINPTCFYLIIVPVSLLLLSLMLARPLTEFSRNQAIENSREIINAIEKHYTDYGRYPTSVMGVWKDYSTSVIGIERYRYASQGEGYSICFEQPLFLLDRPGTREFLIYNTRNEHMFPSHESWILIWPMETVRANQGWYETHNAEQAHWKIFWFD